MRRFTYKFEFSGLVQGVGFRPFLYNVALKLKLCGEVFNDTRGVVLLINASKDELLNFKQALKKHLPPLARIDKMSVSRLKLRKFENFSIKKSQENFKSTPILSDFALCKTCKKEFNSPKNPRFHYPFITCTNCGVRFSIIKGLPYDRKNTTMDAFKMCAFCKSEYEDPLNSRFHAQPISCPKCGINVYLKNKNAQVLASNKEAFLMLAKLLKKGKIIAIKGVGGFHLCCDALNLNSIKRLRELKNRPSKPLALLCEDIKMASNLAIMNQKEKEALDSKTAPIMLLKKKKNINKNISKALDLVALNTDKIGIVLASQGLQLLIFKHFKKPLIATSANLKGECIIYKEEDLLKKLSHSFDFYLDHERKIENPSDDSIAFMANHKLSFLRTSRGINPYYIELSKEFQSKNALALGSELKNQFVIAFDHKLIISPYIGDLKNLAVRERQLSLLEFFKQNYDLKFDVVLADKHPHFAYTKDFEISLRVQHHYAHICAVLFEHKIYKKCLAFCFDGTGYGDDGRIWGGELFLANLKSYERIGHFKDFKLINADIKNVQNLALSLILSLDLKEEASKFLAHFDTKRLFNLEKIYQQSRLYTSSLGRIIDAFAALIFDLKELEYEAQSGMLIEKFYDFRLDFSYEFDFNGSEICVKNALKAVLHERDKKKACTGFLNALASIIIKTSQFYNDKYQNEFINILCGGVFQNATLLQILHKKHFKFKTGNIFPVNDSSIALGQMAHFLYKG